MDFSFSEKEKMIIAQAEKILKEEIEPFAKTIGYSKEAPVQNIKTLSRYDFFAVPFPFQYGGLGLSYLLWAYIGSLITKYCTTTGTIFGAQMLSTQPILDFGSNEQKEKYLPSLIKGDSIGAFALTEPDTGSDAASVRTHARKNENYYIINGNKMYITNAGIADLYIIIVKTDPSKGARGMSAIIVEKNTPGFIIGKQENKMAFPALPNAELAFYDCRVPKENLLGREGEGFKIAMNTLDLGRIGVAAGAIGLAKRAYEEALKYSKERKQFGVSISSFELIQEMIAEMATLIDAAENLYLKAAWEKDCNLNYAATSAKAKYFSSKVVKNVTDKAIQIFGGYGYGVEYPVERLFREARLFELVEGTTEIQKLIIAKNELKK